MPTLSILEGILSKDAWSYLVKPVSLAHHRVAGRRSWHVGSSYKVVGRQPPTSLDLKIDGRAG